MDVSEWIKETVGTDDRESLLNPEYFSDTELANLKREAELERDRLEQEMSQYKEKYEATIRNGAVASGPERKRFAKKATQYKKRYKIAKRKYRRESVRLATLIAIETIHQRLEQAEETTSFEKLIDDETEITSLQNQLSERMVQHDLDTDVMQDVQQALEIETLHTEFAIEESTEMEMIENRAAGTVDADSIDIDADLPSGPDLDIDSAIGDDLEFPSDIESPGDPVTTDINRTEDDRLEIDIQSKNERVVRVRSYDSRVAVLWETNTSVEQFVTLLTDAFAIPGSERIEARWETDDGGIEGVTGALKTLDSTNWFPDHCRLLAIAAPEYEIRWEDDPGQPEEFTVSITTSEPEDAPLSDLLKETVRGELSDSVLEQLMGKTEFLIEEYSFDG